MNHLETLAELFRHMEWADSMVWAAALVKPEAGEDAALRERLYHIHMVQRAFLKVWKNEAVKPPASASFPNLPALLSWTRDSYGELNEYAAHLGELDLERPVVMPWIEMFEARMGRKADVPTFHETLLQVVMHSAYHRGQVSTRLRELGAEPPLTDFIAWVWRGKPQPDWPVS
jgi:uncharacterized damage-inducible protein DinB